MKKHFFLFIFICIRVTDMFAQIEEYEYVPFPTSDAIWYEQYSDYLYVYEAFKITGEDTIMNDLSYKKLFVFQGAAFDENNARCIGGIREDANKRVYYRGEIIRNLTPAVLGPTGGGMFEDEVLLYDFSLLVGDTLKAGNFTAPLTEGYPFGECLVVSSIDTVKVGNSYRKQFSFEIGYISEHKNLKSSVKSSTEYFSWLSWIEGIGNGLGLLYTTTDIPTGGGNWLRCFEHNKEMLYCDNDPCNCYNLSVIKKNFKENLIKVYPNPITDHLLYFEFGEVSVDFIEIFNCTGVFERKYIVGNLSKFNISTEKYLTGIYYYKAIDKEGVEYIGKFIVK